MNEYVLQPLGRLFRQPSFVICVVVLAVCAGGLHIGARQLQVHFRKEAAPLRKPLNELDMSKLAEYELVESFLISEEIEEELGTKDYIQWFLRDTSVEANDPRSMAMIFITYYTGNPDRVPHVPDWCYVGSGGQMQRAENVVITVPDNGTDSDELRVRVLEIKIPRQMGWDTKTVVYFFSVNGDYRCTRREVQIRQGRLWDKYAFFSKVELNLANPGSLGREEIIEALTKLARQLVPVLVKEHWPDLDSLEGDVGQRAAADTGE